MSRPLRWIAACLTATILLAARPTIQAFLWIGLKSGTQAGRDFLRLLIEFPLLTLFLLRWDFVLGIFPASLAVALCWRAGRKLGSKIIYAPIAIYFAASIIDVFHPVDVNPPLRIWFILVSNLLLCPLFSVVIACFSTWFRRGVRSSKNSTLGKRNQ